MGTNEISHIDVVDMEGDDGPGVAITLALDIADPATAAEFLPEVIEAFKIECHDTPRASILLISILGDLSAEEFVRLWRAAGEGDEPLAGYLAPMKHADVIQGTAEGKLVSSASLLH